MRCGGPTAEPAHALLDVLLRCTGVHPDQRDAVLARRHADPNVTGDERGLLSAAASLAFRQR